MNISEILKDAPRYITLRYGSLNQYVWETLFPNDYRKKKLSRYETKGKRKEEYSRMKLITDEATLLIFIFVAQKFFSDSAEMSKRTVDIFKESGVKGFSLGNKYFSERNENVVMGDKLRDQLLEGIDEEIKKIIKETKYISEIINEYEKVKKQFYG